MARIDPRRNALEPPRRRSLLWRGTKAVGASASRAVGRRLGRLVMIALMVLVAGLLLRGVVIRIQTPGSPSRVVAASAGTVLQRLRQANLTTLTLTEADLTAAFGQAVQLPTFPYGDGQVAVTDAGVELFGHLKRSAVTATVVAQPRVREGQLDFEITAITVGQQTVPRFLFGLLAVGTVDQAALFANQLVPPLAAVRQTGTALTLEFQ